MTAACNSNRINPTIASRFCFAACPNDSPHPSSSRTFHPLSGSTDLPGNFGTPDSRRFPLAKAFRTAEKLHRLDAEAKTEFDLPVLEAICHARMPLIRSLQKVVISLKKTEAYPFDYLKR